MTQPTAYECTGYRLPTRAEWQYAARAGTTMAFYSGAITPGEKAEISPASSTAAECDPSMRDPMLDPIAWYCQNSGLIAHPVGGKLPNAWGLHDMLGNVQEMLHDVDRARSPRFPARDPFGDIGEPRHGRPLVGGSAIAWPSLLRIAGAVQIGADTGVANVGFRLARTLGPGRVPARSARDR
jgi:formylglycine-generating enzyme required for sulfatase activity